MWFCIPFSLILASVYVTELFGILVMDFTVKRDCLVVMRQSIGGRKATRIHGIWIPYEFPQSILTSATIKVQMQVSCHAIRKAKIPEMFGCFRT